MLKIEDKTTKHYGKLVENALRVVFATLPEEDLKDIDKILLLDECGDEKFKWAGGFYSVAHDAQPAYIELYPPKIIKAQPFFLPKIDFFNKYSIVKMFLHELGHNKYGIKNMKTREMEAEKYTLLYLEKLYGKWVHFYDFLGAIDNLFRR